MGDIGNLIKNRRLELGLTLEEVGDAVGVGKSTVRKWETGHIQNMRRDRIALLAKVLQMDPSLLIEIQMPGALDQEEQALLDAWRSADQTAREYAMMILSKSAEGQEAKKRKDLA